MISKTCGRTRSQHFWIRRYEPPKMRENRKKSVYLSIYISRRWQARPRILLLPHSPHIDIVKLASIVIRNYNDFSKSPILGAKKSMLELRQGLETLQSSEMMPKPTSTQISSPGDIGKGVFQNPHFQSNSLHIHIYIYTDISVGGQTLWQSKTCLFVKLIDS